MATRCPYGEPRRRCSMDKRHDHAYRPPGICTQRCTCGSRSFILKVGGPLPPVVVCERCTRDNKTATAYERGRFSPHPPEVTKVPF
jgi:hypothetical protein